MLPTPLQQRPRLPSQGRHTEPAAFVDSGLGRRVGLGARRARQVGQRRARTGDCARVSRRSASEKRSVPRSSRRWPADPGRRTVAAGGLAPAAAPAAAEGVGRPQQDAPQRIMRQASNRIRRSRAIFEGGDLPVDDDEEGGAGKAQQNV